MIYTDGEFNHRADFTVKIDLSRDDNFVH